ncbi:MAG: hypothetical protein M5R36_28935 [Deltaproteobacteria bacterium]|nr:hypothetical protein [Deltaproteobacteria bacterium]
MPTPTPAYRRDAVVYALLAAAFALSFLPYFLQASSTWDDEEQMNGNLAKDLADGLVVPAIEYRYHDWTTGQWLTGFLLYPLFAVFGRYASVIKLLGAAFSFGTYLLWFAFLRRYAGWVAACAMAALFLFPPPFFAHYTMVTFANHKESAFLAIALVYGLYRLLERDRSPVRAAALGVFAGLSTFYCFQASVPAVVAAILLTGARTPRRAMPELASYTLGFVAGFAPFTAYYYAHGVRVLRFFHMPAGQPDGVSPAVADKLLVKFPDLLFRALPASFKLGRPGTNALLLGLVAVALVVLLLLSWRRLTGFLRSFLRAPEGPYASGPPAPEAAVILLVAVFFGAYTVSDYAAPPIQDEYWNRYLLPLYPPLFALVALAVARLGRARGALLLAPFLLLTLSARDARLLRAENLSAETWRREFREATALRGYAYLRFLDEGFARHLRSTCEAREPCDPCADAPKRVTRAFRWKAYEVCGRVCGEMGGEEYCGDESVPPDSCDFFRRGWTAGRLEAGARDAGVWPDAPDRAVREVLDNAAKPEDRVPTLEGIGLYAHESLLASTVVENTYAALASRADPMFPHRFRIATDALRGVGDDGITIAAEGFGLGAPRKYGFYLDYETAFARLFPEEPTPVLLDAFYVGVGRRAAWDIAGAYHHIGAEEWAEAPGNLFRYDVTADQQTVEKAIVLDERAWMLIRKGHAAGLAEIGLKEEERGGFFYFPRFR